MIDEIENFTVTQQKFLNSLIRYRHGPVSIKIGHVFMPPYQENVRCWRRNQARCRVWGSGAWRLASWTDEGYKGLARDLILKRLQQFQLTPSGEDCARWLKNQFEELDPSNNYRIPTLALVKSMTKRVKFDHISKSWKTLSIAWRILAMNHRLRNSRQHCAGASTANDPLLEKVNLYLLYKEWRTTKNLLETATVIGKQARNFLEMQSCGAKYFQSLDHFKSDLLAQIYQDCSKQHIVYAGLDTLYIFHKASTKSSWLLKQIYRRSHFAGERPFQEGGRISISSQGEGIRDAAAWFWMMRNRIDMGRR